MALFLGHKTIQFFGIARHRAGMRMRGRTDAQLFDELIHIVAGFSS